MMRQLSRSAFRLFSGRGNFVNRKGNFVRALSTTGKRTTVVHDSQEGNVKWRPKLVIFDKMGTLINLDSPWVPWIQHFSQRVEDMVNLEIKDQLLSHLNVCLFTNRVKSGVLASGTSAQIKAHVQSFLEMQGINKKMTSDIIGKCWKECDTSDPRTLQELSNLSTLFETITDNNMKIALLSSDARRVTEKTMSNLHLLPHISLMVCGDDGEYMPKPHPTNINHICSTLSFDPRDAVVVGDTENDMRMGSLAGVGMTIGVLCGTGTRLELAHYADILAQNAQEALPHILNPPIIETHRAIETRKNSKDEPKSKAQAVIFDKDGTLICFHSMWTPWAKLLVESLETETGLQLSEPVMQELGYCLEQRKWVPGLFAEGTVAQSKEKLITVLEEKGLQTDTAKEVIDDVWSKTDDLFPHDKVNENLVVFDNPTVLFKVLKQNGIKVAVCTADSRHATLQFLESIGAEQYVDFVMCGDDPQSIPKPSPHNAITICEELNVDPEKVVVVGDTLADLGMGRSAKLGATVAVLTGVGNVEHLQDHADHVVPSIKDVLPLVLSNTSQQLIKE